MKTPIQELIREIEQLSDIGQKQNNVFGKSLSCALKTLSEFTSSLYLKKEKQFAKECFEAGLKHGIDTCHSIEWAEYPTTSDFEQFYSKYVEQHTK